MLTMQIYYLYICEAFFYLVQTQLTYHTCFQDVSDPRSLNWRVTSYCIICKEFIHNVKLSSFFKSLSRVKICD